MPTLLSLHDHLKALVRGGAALGDAAAAAGLEAKVPTCPGWNVTKLVLHQGMVHRWAAANLRGERDHDPAASQAEGRAAANLLDWYAQGLAALVDTLGATAEDARAMVFLRDAPAPRRFWIDELLMGFITRGKGQLHTPEPCTLLVRTDDTGHAWTLRISEGPILTTPGASSDPRPSSPAPRCSCT